MRQCQLRAAGGEGYQELLSLNHLNLNSLTRSQKQMSQLVLQRLMGDDAGLVPDSTFQLSREIG